VGPYPAAAPGGSLPRRWLEHPQPLRPGPGGGNPPGYALGPEGAPTPGRADRQGDSPAVRAEPAAGGSGAGGGLLGPTRVGGVPGGGWDPRCLPGGQLEGEPTRAGEGFRAGQRAGFRAGMRAGNRQGSEQGKRLRDRHIDAQASTEPAGFRAGMRAGNRQGSEHYRVRASRSGSILEPRAWSTLRRGRVRGIRLARRAGAHHHHAGCRREHSAPGAQGKFD